MSEWISVEDRLPDMKDVESTIDCLLYFGTHVESGCFFFNEYTGKPYHVFFDGDSIVREPTHWMPLPPPPENK